MADFKRNTSSKPGGRRPNRSSERSRNDSEGRRDSRRSNYRSDSRSSERSRFGGRSSDRIERTTVTCDSCNKSCEVPFKPSSNKPIYCDACYKKESGSKNRRNPSNEFVEINKKLDKIMKALKIE